MAAEEQQFADDITPVSGVSDLVLLYIHFNVRLSGQAAGICCRMKRENRLLEGEKNVCREEQREKNPGGKDGR